MGLGNGVHQQEIGEQEEREVALFILFFLLASAMGAAMFSMGIATTGALFKDLVFTGLHGFLPCPLSPCGGKSFYPLLASGCLFILCFLNPELIYK